MKKSILLLIVCVAVCMFMFVGCSSDDPADVNGGNELSVDLNVDAAAGYQISDEEQQEALYGQGTDETAEFCRMIQGIWAYPNEGCMEFYSFHDKNKMMYGRYPGEYGREGEIVKATRVSEDTYDVELFYPATEGDLMYDPLPEERVTIQIQSPDNFEKSIYMLYNRSMNLFDFFADNLEDAIRLFDYELEAMGILVK